MSGDFPDGIAERHQEASGELPLSLRWLMLGVLGIVLAMAMFGAFGGANGPPRRVASQDGVLTVHAPTLLRNGEFFEMRIVGEALRPVVRPTIAVASGYWRDLTINTMIPAPASESFDDGYFLFEFDSLEAGRSVELKVEGQINPEMFGGTQGVIAWRDGGTVLAETPVRLRVLP